MVSYYDRPPSGVNRPASGVRRPAGVRPFTFSNDISSEIFLKGLSFKFLQRRLFLLKKKHCRKGARSLFHILLFHKFCLFSAYLCNYFYKAQVFFIKLKNLAHHYNGYILTKGNNSVMFI